jgi:sigma-B regulation protein RsbU (phosphoserine phosphatase)
MNVSSHLPPRRGFQSLTTRLIVWTLLSVGSVYGATLAISNALARRMAIAAAAREADNETDAAVKSIRGVLHAVEEQTMVLAETLEALQPAEQGMKRLLRRFVSGNRDVFGAAIAFAPGAFVSRVQHYALYYHRDLRQPDKLVPADLASERNRYWERDWYSGAVRSGQPRWSDPYRDDGGAGLTIVTYSVPFYGPRGGVAGVVTADLLLHWLDARVAEVELGRSGFGVIISASGRIIAASGRRRERTEVSETVLHNVPENERVRLQPVVQKMAAGERGFAPVEVGGVLYRLTFEPIGYAGWSLATLYPEAELLEEVGGLRVIQVSLAVGGLAVLMLVVVILSHRFTRPLQALAASAGQMATGDLDAALPPVETRDEVGVLNRAVHEMRDSLKAYIADLRETTAAKERLESELKVARRIQADMLPREKAGGPGEGYELAATLVPARAVGGDLFHHFRHGSKVAFLVGDVSGKGVPAALFMARTKTLFEAIGAREEDPGAILVAANHNLCTENEAGMFVTCVCGVLDVESGDLAFALAGHEPPVLAPAEGTVAPLSVEGGRVLGLIEESDYPVNRRRLRDRDAVVLYTDGVSEAQDPEGDFFGVERIVDVIGRHRRDDASAITGGLLEAVRAFSGTTVQYDDITLMTLRYLASPR